MRKFDHLNCAVLFNKIKISMIINSQTIFGITIFYKDDLLNENLKE